MSPRFPLFGMLILATILQSSGAEFAAAEEKFVVVKARRVITVTGEEYSPGEIVIVDGKIQLVGTGLEYPDDARIIEARGETVMPGMIMPRTRYDLPDYGRNGVHGDLKAIDEVILPEVDFEKLLSCGFTTACFYPSGGGIPGIASAIRCGGPEAQRRLNPQAYLRTSMTNPSTDRRTLSNALQKARSEIEKVKKAREEWEKKQKEKEAAEKAKQEKEAGEGEKPSPEQKPQSDKKAAEPEPKPGDGKEGEKKEEPEAFKPPDTDPKYKPLISMLEKKKAPPILFEVNDASDLLHLADLLKREKDELTYNLYMGSSLPRPDSDFDLAIDAVAEMDVLVLMEPGVFYRSLTVERINVIRRLAARGVHVAFTPWRDRDTDLENYRQRLAAVVRSGLDRKDALKGACLYPAQLLGLGDRLGSVEKEKDADLLFFDGDPLDPMSDLRRVAILGDIVWEAEK